MQKIRNAVADALEKGQRLFIGFDFAFGYPAGAAQLFAGKADWWALWQVLGALVKDDEKNRSNRFEAAGQLNRISQHRDGGPFWGHPHQHKNKYDALSMKKPASLPASLSEKRLAERRTPGAKSVWQLSYNGAVGSQSLLGIPRLNTLLRDRPFRERIAVWPFETGFASDLSRPVTLAEIYPSVFGPPPATEAIKDAGQVRMLAEGFARLDAKNRFGNLLARPEGLSEEEYQSVIQEEGWIVGAGRAGDLS